MNTKMQVCITVGTLPSTDSHTPAGTWYQVLLCTLTGVQMQTQDTHVHIQSTHVCTPHVHAQGIHVCTSISSQNKHLQDRHLWTHKDMKQRVGHTPKQT